MTKDTTLFSKAAIITRIVVASSLLTSVFCLGAQAAPKGLDIYFVDVEGGAATLIVTPQGESLLVDSGWKRDDLRDAKRIHDTATRLAGLKKIDYYVTSHFHTDHFGSISQLVNLIPITKFYDHALMQDSQEHDKNLYPEYLKVAEGKRQVLKAGETIPLKTGKTPLKVICVVSDGRVVQAPVGVGAGVNPFCKDAPLKEEDPSDNAKSIGLLVSYGNFEFLDLGDLTWNIEHKLVCPDNVLGRVDLYMVTHHGMNSSSNPALVKAIQPTVSVMCNGARKAGFPETVALLKSLPSLKAAYQLHRNVETSEAENTSKALIANWDENCQGQFIKASVAPNGKSYTVRIGEKGKSRHFQSE
jgi:beta-lactamase superfamily II metal-dependent hydrolase